MQQGKPPGLAKNARGGICPAGRDCTFGGMPVGQAASEGTTFLQYMQIYLLYSQKKSALSMQIYFVRDCIIALQEA